MITGEWGVGCRVGGGEILEEREGGSEGCEIVCGSAGVREYTFARVWMRGRGEG